MTLDEARAYIKWIKDNPLLSLCACRGGEDCCIIRYNQAKKIIEDSEYIQPGE